MSARLIRVVLFLLDQWSTIGELTRHPPLRRVPCGRGTMLPSVKERVVDLDWPKMKAEGAAEATDEYHESLPEDKDRDWRP